MSDAENDVKKLERKVVDLAQEMDRMRDHQASRDDVVVDMKEASHTRLQLLAKELQPVFDDIPDDNDQFEFALTNGEPPRLWIDMTSFVRMGRDRRVYEFVKDTRLGRNIMGKTQERERMAKIVAAYVAERMLERERMIEGEWTSMKGYDFDDDADRQEQDTTENSAKSGRGWLFLLWFLLGILGGAAVVIFWALYNDDRLVQFLQNLNIS